MQSSVSEQILQHGDYSSIIKALEELIPTLKKEANCVAFTSDQLLKECAKLPFVGRFAGQSFMTIACLTGLITNCNHAAFAVVSDTRKPHCQALFAMGLTTLEAVNKVIRFVAIQLGIPEKTVENTLCKVYRRHHLLREFSIPWQRCYLLVQVEGDMNWSVATREWGETVWERR